MRRDTRWIAAAGAGAGAAGAGTGAAAAGDGAAGSAVLGGWVFGGTRVPARGDAGGDAALDAADAAVFRGLGAPALGGDGVVAAAAMAAALSTREGSAWRFSEAPLLVLAAAAVFSGVKLLLLLLGLLPPLAAPSGFGGFSARNVRTCGHEKEKCLRDFFQALSSCSE